MKKLIAIVAVVLLVGLTISLTQRPEPASLLQHARAHGFGGAPAGGALALADAEGGWLDLGRYDFGWTLMTPYRLEMHPCKEFSISCYGVDCLPKFQVRNIGDTEGSIWINGNNIIGSQFGPISFALGSFNDGGREIARFEKDGDLTLLNDLLIDNRSLKQQLAELEARLAALEAPR